MQLMTTPNVPVVTTQPPAGVPSHERLVSGLARSLARVGARERLDRELRLLAVDLLGPSASDELPADCSAWMAAAIESAVRGVSEASLSALVETLEAQLAAAPPGIARRLNEARIRHDAGFI
jgi:hypothetical protein